MVHWVLEKLGRFSNFVGSHFFPKLCPCLLSFCHEVRFSTLECLVFGDRPFLCQVRLHFKEFCLDFDLESLNHDAKCSCPTMHMASASSEDSVPGFGQEKMTITLVNFKITQSIEIQNSKVCELHAFWMHLVTRDAHHWILCSLTLYHPLPSFNFKLHPPSDAHLVDILHWVGGKEH